MFTSNRNDNENAQKNPEIESHRESTGTQSSCKKYFMSAEEIYEKLNEPNTFLDTIPNGIKENIYFIISDEVNSRRKARGRKPTYADDCGVWDTKLGRTVVTYFVRNENNSLTSLRLKNGEYSTKKIINGNTTYPKIDPQPSLGNVIRLSRYYCTLKRCKDYKRRISRIVGNNLVLVEYIGAYTEIIAPHGNAMHQDSAYVRTNPKVLERIADLTEYTMPRLTYKKMTLDDSSTAARDFKQVRNVKYQKQLKNEKVKIEGNKANLADEVLECATLVNSNDFVQQVRMKKGKMPNFICFTEHQKQDLKFFLAQRSRYVLGIDRTFNLGCYYVTAIAYKNLRVVRSNDENIHPITLGPMLLHRDADFETYNYFFSSLKGELCESIHSVELSLGRDIIIGSDEEKAITKALDVNFPAASRFLCAKHLKDGTNAYMQKTVGIPQKERSEISRSIFGESGLVSANSSFTFDNKTGVVMSKISKYPKFVEYFRKNLEPAIRNNVNTPMRNATFSKLWTNNNCESINHIMKLDAEWKHQKTKTYEHAS